MGDISKACVYVILVSRFFELNGETIERGAFTFGNRGINDL
jgi:hypothetical protein